MQRHDDGKRSEDIPRDLQNLPLRNIVAFPFLILPPANGTSPPKKLFESDELPENVRQSPAFVTMDQIQEALEAALGLKIPVPPVRIDPAFFY